MRKILITGGPVHAHLDDVKIVTNRFRGGLIAALATRLAQAYPCEVTYLTAPGATCPDVRHNLKVLKHQGFWDYQAQVLALAPEHTDVVLGAAVANLIPAKPWKGKFPSHNYAEGEIVSVDFVVTPRVITQVKTVAPHVNLFGFKLLSGASHEELLNAAWHTLVDSKAIAVIANDAKNLQTKFIRTKEGGVHALPNSELAAYLWQTMQNEYYRTETLIRLQSPESTAAVRLGALIAHYHNEHPELFVTTPEGLVFGTAAVRGPGGGFWTTGRGKHELTERSFVAGVDHASRTVSSEGGKSSLNAPLLATIFEKVPCAEAIVHGHVQDLALPTLPYATPGTTQDSLRAIKGSFNIEGHGCFYLLDAAGATLMQGAPL